MAGKTKRGVVNFILAVAAGLCFISGVLLFFKIKTILIVRLHEWAGMVFVAAAVFHFLINWKPFLHSLKPRSARIAILVILIAGVAGMIWSTTQPSQQRRRPPSAVRPVESPTMERPAALAQPAQSRG